MSTESGQVRIGREFFAKIKLDYADWRWALVREFLQNCFDAPGCKITEITIESVPNAKNQTIMTVKNNGAPMNKDTLLGKLLTLGGSGKNFEGANTGGFGVAKTLLYLCHDQYEIHTGNLLVRGAGGEYSISEGAPFLNGTTSRIVLTSDTDEVNALRAKVLRFAALARWRGKLFVNGTHIPTDLRAGHKRRDLGWATIHTNQQAQNLCVIRLNGQPMFTRYTRFKGCVIVELAGKAYETLTSNRDGLVSKYANELSGLLTAIATDKKSALREQRASYKRYAGEIQRNEMKKPKESEQSITDIIGLAGVASLLKQAPDGPLVRIQGNAVPVGADPVPESAQHPGIRVVIESRNDEPDRSITLGPQFILKNSTGMTVPQWYVPGEKFTDRSRELVRSWTAILLKLYQLTNRSGAFSVGFSFDEESEAEHEGASPYGQVYYLNPIKLVTDGKRGGSRKMVSRFDGAWMDRYQLISLAAHEFVHGAYGLAEHDENYADVLTDLMILCMKHSNELQSLCTQSTGTHEESKDDDDRTRLYLSRVCGMSAEQLARLV